MKIKSFNRHKKFRKKDFTVGEKIDPKILVEVFDYAYMLGAVNKEIEILQRSQKILDKFGI